MARSKVGSNSLYGPLDPAPDAGYVDAPPRMGFFTDTSVCIGCKACEVACKEWNLVPEDGLDLTGMSYDNTGSLNANTWRHVAFIEQPVAGPGLRRPKLQPWRRIRRSSGCRPFNCRAIPNRVATPARSCAG